MLALSQRIHPYFLAALLAFGVLVPWFFVVVLASAFNPALTSIGDEGLIVLRDGQICRQRSQILEGEWQTTIRTLDGQEVEASDRSVARAINLSVPPTKTLVGTWSPIQPFVDLRSKPTYWFFIRDRRTPGSAYFELFDSATKLRIGCLGPQGFRPDVPPLSERFQDVSNGLVLFYSQSDIRYERSLYVRVRDALLIADGNLWRIDLEKRALERIALPGRAIEAQVTDQYDANGILVVRTDNMIVTFDHENHISRQVSIPEDLRNTSLASYVDTPTPILVSSRFNDSTEEVIQFDDKGDITSRETVRLDRAQSSTSIELWGMIILFPSQLIQAFIAWSVAMVKVEGGRADSLLSGLAETLAAGWAEYLVLFVISALLAVLCYRHHRRYAERGSVAWALFVFIGGVPAALGYWLHRSWPSRAACPACNTVVPRNRSACLSCAAEFPTPAPLGIEIFA